jgi:hypothetical protein
LKNYFWRLYFSCCQNNIDRVLWKWERKNEKKIFLSLVIKKFTFKNSVLHIHSMIPHSVCGHRVEPFIHSATLTWRRPIISIRVQSQKKVKNIFFLSVCWLWLQLNFTHFFIEAYGIRKMQLHFRHFCCLLLVTN